MIYLLFGMSDPGFCLLCILLLMLLQSDVCVNSAQYMIQLIFTGLMSGPIASAPWRRKTYYSFPERPGTAENAEPLSVIP
jgi:hypothetical protein